MSVHLLMWSHIVIFYVISDVRACPQRKRKESMLELDYQSSYIKEEEEKKGQLVNSDNRIDFDRQDHLTCLLISCLSQFMIQMTMMTLLLRIHYFIFLQRKKKTFPLILGIL